MLKDSFGRTVSNLRIAVTNRCNLSCIYCHREGEINPRSEISAEKIAEISKAFYELGIRKVKLTGGEPLLRRDICEIISMMPKFEEISLTTNGVFLEDFAYDLKDSGLNRVNISLDTLNPEIFKFITGSDDFDKVIGGINTAVDANLTPVKLNMVLMKGLNDSEVQRMLKFTNSFNKEKINVILQLIELITNSKTKNLYIDPVIFEEGLSKIATAIKIRDMQRRKQFFTPLGVVEIVKPLDNTEFCMHCNRIRITSDGKIKLCLMSDEVVDISNLSGNELKKAIIEALKLKKPFFR